MKQHDGYQGHLLVTGVAAFIASGVVAIAGLTLAQVNGDTPPEQTSPPPEQTSPPPEQTSPPPEQTSPPPEQQQDPCTQAHSYQGDRCTKEQMLMKYGCVPDISPECKDGSTGNQPWGQQYPSQEQQGPTLEQINQALRDNNGGVCFVGDRWSGNSSPLECAKNFGQWHGPYTQPIDQYHSAPDRGGQGMGNMMSPGMMGPGRGDQMGPGGFPGMGGQMGPGMGGMGPGMMGPGGPGRGGPMSCDMFNDMIEEMKSRLMEMDEETKDRLSDMEENMHEKAADQIERLQDKIDGTDDEKKIAKYRKQIAKIEGKIEKQIVKMKARMEKQMAKMKARMEKEIAKLEDKAAECEDNEDEGGDDFGGGGGFDGGGFGGPGGFEGGFPGGPGGFPGGGFGGPGGFPGGFGF